MVKYQTQGVCAKEIQFDVVEGRVRNLMFTGGCPGNLNAICRLVEGMTVAEVIEKFQGNICRNQTSCTDQLAQALQTLA